MIIRDLVVTLFIEIETKEEEETNKQNLAISYKINECCTQLEDIKCIVNYKMSEDGHKINLIDD